jgi:flagellar motor switch protein FliM
MSRVVSEAELAAILTTDPVATSGAVAYDFRRPDRVTAPQLRSVRLLHEAFAGDAGTWLSAVLRTTTELELLDVDQLSYGDFIATLPEFTTAYALAMAPLDAFLTLTISPDVTFTMVDRILGGSGTTDAPDRPLTEIEQHVVDSVVKILLDQLTGAWRSIGVQFSIHARHSRAAMLPVTRANDIIVVLSLALRVAETRGSLRVCIPASVFDAVGEGFAKTPPDAPRPRSDEQSAWLRTNLERVPLAITAELTTTLAAREIIDLAPGVVLSLGHQSDQPLTVSVGDVPVFIGHIVVHNSSLAVRVAGERAERIPASEERK